MKGRREGTGRAATEGKGREGKVERHDGGKAVEGWVLKGWE